MNLGFELGFHLVSCRDFVKKTVYLDDFDPSTKVDSMALVTPFVSFN